VDLCPVVLPSAQEGRAPARPQRCEAALEHFTWSQRRDLGRTALQRPSGALRPRRSAALLRCAIVRAPLLSSRRTSWPSPSVR